MQKYINPLSQTELSKEFNPYHRLFVGIMQCLSVPLTYALIYPLGYAMSLYMPNNFNLLQLVFVVLCLMYMVWFFYGVWFFWRGVVKIVSWNVGPLAIEDNTYFWVPIESGEGRRSKYSRINDVMDYRDCKLHNMSRENGSELYMSTQMFSSKFAESTQGERMLDYVNGNLSTMSRESGLKYIQSLAKSK